MIHDLPVTAVKTGNRLKLVYDGFHRIVEVHAVGVPTANNLCMRVYQTSGGSVSNEPIGWKMMTLDKSFSLHLTDEVSSAPRPGYARNNRGMRQIFAQL